MSSQVGIFYFDGRPIPEAVERSLRGVLGAHDVADRGSHRDAGLFIAHAMSELDELSLTERQPCVSQAGNVLTFDGRIDNRDELVACLRQQLAGHRTDSALALAAYEAWGEQGLSLLIGDWSLVCFQHTARQVLLASDYAGIRPLYYHVDHERVIWGSYLKPLIALAVSHEVDDVFVAGFLSGTSTPGHTPYRGIHCVRSGHVLLVSARGVASKPFWKLPIQSRVRYADERDYERHLLALFHEAVRARLRTRGPVCSDLSGGLDSSSVVCMASHLIAERAVEASDLITFSYGPPGHSDEPFYRVVQQYCGREGRYIDTCNFPFLSAEHLDDAVPGVWAPLRDELARQARDLGARVYLTGSGGDLVMGQWINDCEQVAEPIRRGHLARTFTEALAWSKATQFPLTSVLWRGLLAALPAAIAPLERYKAQERGAVHERHGDSLTSEFKSRTSMDERAREQGMGWIDALPERRKHFCSLATVLQSQQYRVPERLQHLHYTHPYLHRPLVEFLFALPASLLCGPGEPRKLMRRAFAALLPKEVLQRRSKGVFTGTFLESVRPLVRELLADRRPLQVVERGYVESEEVRERLERITQALPCNEPQLRQIVMLELWLRAREREGAIARSGFVSSTVAIQEEVKTHALRST